jgi:hypothetical protein
VLARSPQDGEGRPDRLVILASPRRQPDSPPGSFEQLEGQLVFEQPDVATDSALREPELGGRARETFQPASGLERTNGMERRHR